MPKPYDKTTHDGKTVDWMTHAALLEAEIKLGYRLTIVQGSYHKGVGASAGTHDGGGCVDLAPFDHVRKVRVLRELGWAIWHRPTLRGVWSEHIHGVLIGNAKVAAVAGRQITSYRNRRDGLAGNRADNTFHPSPIPTYKWPGSKAALALEAKAKKLLDKPVVPPVTALRVDGIDLSHHNTVTQAGLAAAHKAGVKYVYLKATEGSTIKDAAYTNRRTMVTKAGMIVGAYHFARPDKNGRDGTAEAKFFLSVAKPVAGDMRPVLDLEDKTLTGKARDAWVADFVAEVKAQVGVTPVIYTPFDLASTFGCPLWVARYTNDNAPPTTPKPWRRWRMRQFSDGKFGKPNTIAGMHVDLNTLHDVADLDWLRIPVKPAPAPAPAPAPKAVTLTVHLAPGNKHQKPEQIAADMGHVKTPGLVFTTEHDSPEERTAVHTGLGHDWDTLFDNEDVMGYSTALLTKTGQRTVKLAKEDSFLAHVSPTRWANIATFTVNGLSSEVSAIGTHLVSEANCVHIHVPGRKWREKTYKIQIEDLIRETRAELNAGRAVTLAGDMNTGKFFTGAQLLARLQKEFGQGNVAHAYSSALDQVYLISSKKVRLTAGKATQAKTSSDHPMGIVPVTAEEN